MFENFGRWIDNNIEDIKGLAALILTVILAAIIGDC